MCYISIYDLDELYNYEVSETDKKILINIYKGFISFCFGLFVYNIIN